MSTLYIIIASIICILFIVWIVYDIIKSTKLKKEKGES